MEALIVLLQILGYLILGVFLAFFAVQIASGIVGTTLAIIGKVKEKIKK